MSSSLDPAAVVLSHSPLVGRTETPEGGRRLLAAIERVAALVTRFKPDLVVMFGPDHRRALGDLVPPFSVASTAVGYGDWDTLQEPYDVPEKMAVELVAYLLGRDFDVAHGTAMRPDHGFGQSLEQLFGSLSACPVLPIVINCAVPPLPTAARSAALGHAVGDFLAMKACRVLAIGSGGLSHSPPSMAAGFTRPADEAERTQASAAAAAASPMLINSSWDHRFMAQLAGSPQDDFGWLRDYDDAYIAQAGSGAHEIRTWVAAAACAGRGGPLRTVAYEPVQPWITGMGVMVSDRLTAA